MTNLPSHTTLRAFWPLTGRKSQAVQYAKVILHAGREQSLLRRHQWVFSGAIKKKDKSISDGDVVSIYDHRGNVLATGHFQDSSIAVRVLAFEATEVNTAFWKQKLMEAYAYRHHAGLTHRDDTTAFRLVHGEGDELPGLIIDIYDRVAVFQAHSIGMYLHRVDIAHALMSIKDLQLETVFDRSVAGLSSPEDSALLAGREAGTVNIIESSIRFSVDIATGQKTGFFLDQRINRQLVKSFATGKDVLNCFCYTGGFSLYALAGNAQSVTSVDVSVPAMEILEQNLRENVYIGKHSAVCADVMDYLRDTDQTFDVVICDPPAFAKSVQKRHNAVQAYKRLNALAIQHVKPGGMLFTFSCSQVIDRQLFNDTITAAAIESGRVMRVICELQQAPDHPVSVYHPEGHYLKGLALHIS